jgi:hypothetical protein
LHQQPNQPEVIQIVSEMYMRNNDGSKLISLIEKADQIFTSWKSNGTYDSVTLASLFQKLGNYAAKVRFYFLTASKHCIYILYLWPFLMDAGGSVSLCGELTEKKYPM